MQPTAESAFRPYMRQEINPVSSSLHLPGFGHHAMYAGMEYPAYTTISADNSPSYPANTSSHSSGGGKDKSRRVRTQFSWKQLQILEKEYTRQKYPDMMKRHVISQATDLNETQIKIWFQNRRSKEKKDTGVVAEVKDRNSSSPTGSDANLVTNLGQTKKDSVLISMLNSPASTGTEANTPTPSGSVSPQVVPTNGNYEMTAVDSNPEYLPNTALDVLPKLPHFNPYTYDFFSQTDYSQLLTADPNTQILASMAFHDPNMNQGHITNDLTLL